MLSGARNDGKVSLRLLSQSPLDEGGCGSGPIEQAKPLGVEQWVPSRYNVRATTDTGQVILWNTLSTAISVFKPEQAPAVLQLLSAKGFESRAEGMAGYLSERGYLVKKGTDELRIFRHKFGQDHYRSDTLELILMSSEDCNFRCKYCYEDFARGTMHPGIRQGIKKLVESRIKRLNRMSIRWFGGEPLYGWEAIKDLAPFFSEMAAKHDVVFGSGITTNGYLLTPEVADDLFKWRVHGFQITIDGMPEDHDCSRPTRDGQGSFAKIFENVKALARRDDDFRATLRVNFDQKNHKRFDEFIDLIQDFVGGDQRFRISPRSVGRWGGENDETLAVCHDEERFVLMRELKAIAGKRGLRVETLRDWNFVGGNVCYAARPYNMLIGASGKVMKCTVVLDKNENNVVGRITEEGELILDDNRMALWTEPAFERDSQCQKCAVLPSCQGISCPLPRMETNDRPCIPTRKYSKAELLEVVKYPTRAARKRQVEAQTPPSDAE
ncbi:radical SAM/SPASM domain-containing protein [Chondromyces apiculatus]|uniref:Arylsulfatase regulator n=1 Tax=Chondromyces apiculatus DSM 436 TaxID=1192034 RepID=A0A017T3I4_9BACT|nr:radical SAM protein [Chondromyces apiculatus]EYF03096.1 Arylsulfatase regulator [Chondromyces apiculatus DSM 436]